MDDTKLKKIQVCDIQLGDIIIKCDKFGVPFPEYCFPLSNLGSIHVLHDYGVQHVYILDTTAKKAETNKIKHEIPEKELDNIVKIHGYNLFAESVKNRVSDALSDFKHKRTFNESSINSLLTDVVKITDTDNNVFANMAMDMNSADLLIHSYKVMLQSVALAKAAGMPEREIKNLGFAALLHDIGKVDVPEKILKKTFNLTEFEMNKYKVHPRLAINILRSHPAMNDSIQQAIVQHHECIDGSGYPDGISGIYMSPSAKILSIVEAYNSMIEWNPDYPRAFSHYDAIKKIYTEAGKKYDAELVKLFATQVGPYPVGSAVNLSNGKIGIITEVNRDNYNQPKVMVIDKNSYTSETADKNHPKSVELIDLKYSKDTTITSPLKFSDMNVNPAELFNSLIKSIIQ